MRWSKLIRCEEVERYKDLKTRLYQDMLDNIVTREEYHEYNQRFSDKLHNAEEAKRELEKKKEKAYYQPIISEFAPAPVGAFHIYKRNGICLFQ